MIMKGATMPVEFVGKILIVIFIVGVIVILLMTFLPEIFNSACASSQLESIGELITDANSANSKTIRSFTVESCMEYVDFSPLACLGQSRGEERFGGTGFYQRCYEFVAIGQASGNCRDFQHVAKPTIDENGNLEFPKDPICDSHKGTLRKLPGGYDNIEIICDDCRLEPGRYTAEVGQHTIKFSKQ